MPKIKTKKAAAKRFRIGGTGRIKAGKAGKRHLTGKKTAKRKRHLKQTKTVRKEEIHRIKEMIPYFSRGL